MITDHFLKGGAPRVRRTLRARLPELDIVAPLNAAVAAHALVQVATCCCAGVAVAPLVSRRCRCACAARNTRTFRIRQFGSYPVDQGEVQTILTLEAPGKAKEALDAAADELRASLPADAVVADEA